MNKFFSQLDAILPYWWILLIGAAIGVVMHFANKRALKKLGEEKAAVLNMQVQTQTSKYVQWLIKSLIVLLTIVIGVMALLFIFLKK